MRRHLLSSCLAACALAIAGCSDTTEPSLLSDAEIEADLAATSGDAIATELDLLGETGAILGLPGFRVRAGLAPVSMPPGLTVTRTVTFYDAQGNVQEQYDDSATASIRIQESIDGTRQGERFTTAVHRDRDRTVSGLEGDETSHIWNGEGTGLDSVTFTGEEGTRLAVESSADSIVELVFNLPRSTNPWPASGQIIRNLTTIVTVSGERGEVTRTLSRRIVVTFPADEQGNVTIQIGERTCTLNLVTRRVTNCS
jgi:hypothetical protein